MFLTVSGPYVGKPPTLQVGSGGKTDPRPLLHCCPLTKERSSMLLGAIYVVSDTLFSELYVIASLLFLFFLQLIAKQRH